MSHDRFSHETSEFPLMITATAGGSASRSTPFSGSSAYSSEIAISNKGAIDIEPPAEPAELKVPFGIDHSEIIDCLLDIANEVNHGTIFPQEFSATTKRAVDDFEMITFSLTYGRPRESGS